MINLIGLKSAIKPANVAQNISISAFGHINLSQKPDTFEHSNLSTCPISFTGKSNRLKEYKKLTQELTQTAQIAQSSLNNQLAHDGWTGKTADAISAIWNSKNRATLVQSDIDSYKEHVEKLDKSIKTDTFKENFKEMFDVEYNHSNIVRYGKKSKQFETALASVSIANYTEEKLAKNIETYNKLSGKLQDVTELKTNYFAPSGSIPCYNQVTSKEEIFENMENSLAEILGGKNVLDKVLTSNGMNSEKASKEDKYKVYGYLSNFIVEASKSAAKEGLKGQTLSQIKEDYDKSYKKAFGTKNDIIARVDKYNASQKAGSDCIRFITGVILNTLGPSSVLANCVYSVATSVAMDVADAKTKDVDKDLNPKSVIINAGLNGACGAINQSIVNKYASAAAAKILSGKQTSDSVGSTLANFVVKEIISKEGVKLPAYAVEAVVKSVVLTMAGLKPTEKGTGLTQKELENSMAVISEGMTYLATAKDNGKLKNIQQKEMIALLNEHICASMKNDTEFSTWINKNKATYQELLNQLVKNELPKFEGKLKV